MCQAAAHGVRRGPLDVMGVFCGQLANWKGWTNWERPFRGAGRGNKEAGMTFAEHHW